MNRFCGCCGQETSGTGMTCQFCSATRIFRQVKHTDRNGIVVYGPEFVEICSKHDKAVQPECR